MYLQEVDCENGNDITSPQNKKKTLAEKKLDLLSKCTDAITADSKKTAPDEESPKPKMSAFAVYVDEKLSQLNKRDRRLAEKRISDVLFDIEMAEDASQGVGRPRPFSYATAIPPTQQPMSGPTPIINHQVAAGMNQHVVIPSPSFVDLQSQTGQSYMDMMKT